MIDVALFPIPNVVAFPGTVVPLHVFEPRYRSMINDSVAANRMIAVCHTRREISPARSEQTVEDALKSNQATYLPQPVFSAGHCEVMETTDDGRIYVNISMSARLRMVEDVQMLPYRIVRCDLLEDSIGATEREVSLQRDIVSFILNLIGKQNPDQLPNFDAGYWLSLPPADFSFQVFQLLRFDADTMQSVLESTSVAERLDTIFAVLTQGDAGA